MTDELTLGATMNEETTAIAVLSTKMDHVVGTLEEIKTALAANSKVFVTRSEWELLAQKNDVIHDAMAKEIVDTEKRIDSIEAKKAPWWIVLTAIGAGLAVFIQAAQLLGLLN